MNGQFRMIFLFFSVCVLCYRMRKCAVLFVLFSSCNDNNDRCYGCLMLASILFTTHGPYLTGTTETLCFHRDPPPLKCRSAVSVWNGSKSCSGEVGRFHHGNAFAMRAYRCFAMRTGSFSGMCAFIYVFLCRKLPFCLEDLSTQCNYGINITVHSSKRNPRRRPGRGTTKRLFSSFLTLSE